MTRAEFLTAFPQMAEAMPKLEAQHGEFIYCASVSFKDGRFVMLTKFARRYCVSFRNPANKDGTDVLECFLSPEAIRAFSILYASCQEDTEADFEALLAMLPAEPKVEATT